MKAGKEGLAAEAVAELKVWNPEADLPVKGGRRQSWRRRKRQQQGRVVARQTMGQWGGPTRGQAQSGIGVLKSRQESENR